MSQPSLSVTGSVCNTMLDAYTPAILATVMRIDATTQTGGVTFIAGSVESKYRLSLKDYVSLRDALTMFVEDYERRHIAGSIGGSGSPLISASSTAAVTASESL